MPLKQKRVVVGVGGGIAAYKAVLLVRALMTAGAEVRVVMTDAATRFVGPVTFTGVTGHPAVVNLWDPSYAGEIHVELGAWADAVVVAPATANLLARAAQGMADDAVLTTIACAKGVILYAPAMHTRMWERPATRRNVAQLEADGAVMVGPVTGPLASGEVGAGRMADPAAIAEAVGRALGDPGDLAGSRIMVTAGPTHEDLDPVRFLGNRSTGKMGYALAARAAARGAEVVLVSGPVRIPPPSGVEVIGIRSARDLEAAVVPRMDSFDAIIMAAAVADYRPATVTDEKIKKGDGDLELTLVRNPDVLRALGERRTGDRPLLVGFAVETDDLAARARGKLEAKRIDLVVANHARVGFGGNDNEVILVAADGDTALPRAPKTELADQILDHVRALFG
ncbi:MAG: bifunctional phosphopantothenoylcysteine decarboxylase/phosphopantothenate--cysteine ligase CoaBC [Deltaproteobacteria bacterium]|nr:bifunctional phosphopantothenoylcysteine decarboxylase/phosphopantothenate--cysteine ligase CoaBC [Deltaproteobacteria bacterium]